MGFLDDLEKAARFQSAINATKDASGKPDPYAAAGAVMGMGHGYSFEDAALLGRMLEKQGAFKDTDVD